MAEYNYGRLDVEPEEIGFRPERLKLLSDYCGSLIDSGSVQAAGFLLARHGKIFAHQAAGRLTFSNETVPVKVNSIKNIASVSKLFTAAAIMKLVEDGLLWLEQPIADIIPEFDTPIHRGIHLRHLLTHTSGLPADPGYFGEPYGMPWFEFAEREEWLKMILSGPLQSQPGEHWSYSSMGFIVLGEIISRSSGQHLHDYIQQKIIGPLRLERTFYEIPESLSSEICTVSEWEHANIISEGTPRIPGVAPFGGGGGVYATLYDLYRFGQCFLNGGSLEGVRILGRKTVEEMLRNQLSGVPAFHWGKRLRDYRQGLGWGYFVDGSTVSPGTFCHEGYGWWSLYVDPQEDFVYISFSADAGGFNPDIMVKPRAIAWSGLE